MNDPLQKSDAKRLKRGMFFRARVRGAKAGIAGASGPIWSTPFSGEFSKFSSSLGHAQSINEIGRIDALRFRQFSVSEVF